MVFEISIKKPIMKQTAILSPTFRTKRVDSTAFNLHEELIEACKKGDPKAQFQFYKLYNKAMYEISLNIVNDPFKAENIMQESFFVAFEKIGFFSDSVGFIDWFKTFVRNRSNDSSRNKHKLDFPNDKSYCGN
jgi:DNA-directed RNA polymerase specialized sigma24 family protein